MDPVQKQPAAQPRIDFHKLRLLVQSGFLLICLYSGYRFYQFYLWAMGSSATFVERPPAIEGFLPISGLVSLKRFLLTGSYDRIHPAALTIFIAALLIAIFFRKGFCGWICPVGFVSHLVERVAQRLKILWRPPNWLDYPLLSFKYLLLAFFSWIILVAMDLAAIEAFMDTPYNLVVDARMLLFFIAPSATTIWVVSILVIGSFFLRNFWCRWSAADQPGRAQLHQLQEVREGMPRLDPGRPTDRGDQPRMPRVPGMRGNLPGAQLSGGFNVPSCKSAGVAPAVGGSRHFFSRLGGGQPDRPLAIGGASGDSEELLPDVRQYRPSVIIFAAFSEKIL